MASKDVESVLTLALIGGDEGLSIATTVYVPKCEESAQIAHAALQTQMLTGADVDWAGYQSQGLLVFPGAPDRPDLSVHCAFVINAKLLARSAEISITVERAERRVLGLPASRANGAAGAPLQREPGGFRDRDIVGSVGGRHHRGGRRGQNSGAGRGGAPVRGAEGRLDGDSDHRDYLLH